MPKKYQYFPDFLYVSVSSESSKGIPPTAVFRPALAASASRSGWQSATSPRPVKPKKKILITQEGCDCYSMAEIFAMVCFLRKNNFEIYYFSSEKIPRLFDFSQTIPEQINCLRNLGEFDLKHDYEICSSHGLSRDELAVLDGDHTIALFKHVHGKELPYAQHLQISDFSISPGLPLCSLNWDDEEALKYLRSDVLFFAEILQDEPQVEYMLPIFQFFVTQGDKILDGMDFDGVLDSFEFQRSDPEFVTWLLDPENKALLEMVSEKSLVNIASADLEFARFLKNTKEGQAYWDKLEDENKTCIYAHLEFVRPLITEKDHPDLKKLSGDQLLKIACSHDEFKAFLMRPEGAAFFKKLSIPNLLDLGSASFEFAAFLLQNESINPDDFISIEDKFYLVNLAAANLEWARFLIEKDGNEIEGDIFCLSKLGGTYLVKIALAHAEFFEFLMRREDLKSQIGLFDFFHLVKRYPELEEQALKIAKEKKCLNLFYLATMTEKQALKMGAYQYADLEELGGGEYQRLNLIYESQDAEPPLPLDFNEIPSSSHEIISFSPFVLDLVNLSWMFGEKGLSLQSNNKIETIESIFSKVEVVLIRSSVTTFFDDEKGKLYREDTCDFFKECLPNLKLIQVDSKDMDLFKDIFSDRPEVMIIDYENKLEKYGLSEDSFLDDDFEESKHYEKKEGLCYVSSGQLATQMNKDSGLKKGKFTMKPIGKGLNTKKSVSVRGGFVEYKLIQNPSGDLVIQCNEPPFRPLVQSGSIQVFYLPQEAILKKFQSATNFDFYQMHQSVPADKAFHRLYSIQSCESLAMLCDAGKSINTLFQVTRLIDGFYYIKNLTAEPLDCSYLLAVPPEKNKSDLSVLPEGHPARAIIEEYLRKPLFQETADPSRKVSNFPEIEEGDDLEKAFDDWAESVYENAEGVCWHRALAVAKKIQKSCPGVGVRLVSLNGNHIALEININSVGSVENWVLVDVLGGGAAEECFEESEFISAASDEPKADLFSLDFMSSVAPSSSIYQELLKKSEIKKITERVELLSSVGSDKNILLVSKDLKKLGLLVSNLSEFFFSHSSFYIQNSSDLEIGRPSLILECVDASNINPVINLRGGALLKFIEMACENSDQQFSLIINWSAFTPQERLALNSILDEKPNLNGLSLPTNLKIIGLCEKLPDDPSFKSRHFGEIYEVGAIDLRIQKPISSHSDLGAPVVDPFIIDLEGGLDWEEKLFGRVVLIKNKMVFQPGPLFAFGEQVLERAVNLLNMAEEEKDKIQAVLELALARGYFLYQGIKINVSPEMKFNYSERKLDFSGFVIQTLKKNIELASWSKDGLLINTRWFDLLLQDKWLDLEKGLYTEIPGEIEKCQGTLLNLYIAGPLTEAQWYCLFKQAEKFNVNLELSLAPGVSIPDAVKIENLIESTDVLASEVLASEVLAMPFVESLASEPLVFSEEGLEGSLENLDSHCFIWDVEDYSFADLFYSIKFDKTPEGFENFKIHLGGALLALLAGEKVILRGEFSQELWDYLAPLRIPGCKNLRVNGENIHFSGHLILERIVPPAPFIAPVNLIYQEEDSSGQAVGTEEDAKGFIEKRKEALLEILEKNSIARVMGPAGVGKSSLMKEIEKSGVKVHYELSSFKDWASDKSPGLKILVIDEHDIEDTHFTFLAPLLNKELTPVVSYEGELYELGRDQVVAFLGNGKSEKLGGRVEQALFTRYSIASLEFRDFSPSYLYYNILKPIFRDSTEIDPTELETKAQDLIGKYLVRNQSSPGSMTVRTLQQEALEFCAEKRVGPAINNLAGTIHSYSFLVTPYIEKAANDLMKALKIKELQKEGFLPAGGLGLNGVIIDGKPGLGKSEMVKACLEVYGFFESDYIKIDAKLARDPEIAGPLILKAFNEGRPLIIDEINACCDHGLEKVLNFVLTSASTNPGFILIGTMNGKDLEGRSGLSGALESRCISCHIEQPRQEDIQEVLSTFYPGLEAGDVEESSSAFVLLQKSHQLTLRELRAFVTDLFPGSGIAPGKARSTLVFRDSAEAPESRPSKKSRGPELESKSETEPDFA